MLITFQFPIADARSFDPEGLRQQLPDWPNPATDIRPQFFNRFGRAHRRQKGADSALNDEVNFCFAHRALRFDDLGARHLTLNSEIFRPQCAFRRLFFDGQAVARVEVGFKHNPGKRLCRFDAYSILSILKHLCEMTVRIQRPHSESVNGVLLRQGPELARLFAFSSVGSVESLDRKQRALTLVEAGNPLLMVEVEEGDVEFPLSIEGFSELPSNIGGDAALLFGRFRSRGGTVATWIHDCRRADRAHARSLRLCLSRLHAEQEVLDILLKQIHRGRLMGFDIKEDAKRLEVVDRMDAYFNARTKLIQRGEWAGIGKSAILNAFDAVEKSACPAARENLVVRYEGARRQVWKKIEDYQIRRATPRLVQETTIKDGGIYVAKSISVKQFGNGNIANTAEYMVGVVNNVSNNVQQSSAPEEVKELVKTLAEQVAALEPKVDNSDLIRQMGSDVQTLSKEMAQPEPRRAWYELTLNGLKEAAETVGGIAGPVLETVKKLAELLLA